MTELSNFNNNNNQSAYAVDEVIEIRRQLKTLQDFIARIDSKKRIGQKAKIRHVFAEQVGVVGLKEALTWRRRPLKVIWIVLVVLGLAATIYYIYKGTAEYLEKETTTKTTLERRASYDYPPLVLCPPWWFETDIINSTLGLNTSAIVYSLGYGGLYRTYLNLDILNGSSPIVGDSLSRFVQQGRDEFLAFYAQRNYTSMEEFYEEMAANISTNLTTIGNGTEPPAVYLESCVGCNQSMPMEKIVFNDAVCYVIRLNPASPIASQSIRIRMTNNDRTSGIGSPARNTWLMDFLTNVGPNGPSIQLSPFTTYSIKVSAQRTIMLKNESNCKDPTMAIGYNQRTCVDECLSRLANGSDLTGSGDPSRMRNRFDVLLSTSGGNKATSTESPSTGAPGGSRAHTIPFGVPPDDDKKKNSSSSEELSDSIPEITIPAGPAQPPIEQSPSAPSDQQLLGCYATCLPICDRLIYDMSINPISNFAEVSVANQSSSSVIDLSITHSALFQGGIVTWQEVPTLTFSDWVSNVGGTLGLFLGCTVLTLAQFVLALVNYAVEKRKRRVTHEVPMIKVN